MKPAGPPVLPGLFERIIEPMPHFDGPAYDPEFDHARLTGQMGRIYELMADGCWRTLREIADVTGDPAASVSAQLRHFRKPRFGRHTVERQIRGEREGGLYEYRLIVRT